MHVLGRLLLVGITLSFVLVSLAGAAEDPAKYPSRGLRDCIPVSELLHIESAGNASEEFSRIIVADLERWAAVARAGNIRIEQ